MTKEGCPGLSLPKLGKCQAGQNELVTLHNHGVLIHHVGKRAVTESLKASLLLLLLDSEMRTHDQLEDELHTVPVVLCIVLVSE